jgi:hypothetical protein
MESKVVMKPYSQLGRLLQMKAFTQPIKEPGREGVLLKAVQTLASRQIEMARET